ncbi:hypothetical protein BS78_04G009400 [Paspalum vaginatum]|nr:hypothetical protein BS78_04G009400 [Paspalum vaginatum]
MSIALCFYFLSEHEHRHPVQHHQSLSEELFDPAASSRSMAPCGSAASLPKPNANKKPEALRRFVLLIGWQKSSEATVPMWKQLHFLLLLCLNCIHLSHQRTVIFSIKALSVS